MSEHAPLEPNPRKLRCEEWEALLADTLDGALTPGDRASFDLHTSECPTCITMLEDAQKGQQWLQFLHQAPQVPAGLVEKIEARTRGTKATGVATANLPGSQLPPLAQHAPEWKRLSIPAGVRRFVEPRMMMTAAMAFFSIALTLNMAGVRLTAMRGQDLRPSVLRTNLERQFYTPVVRYYENLRVVYEVESRMRELRRTTESDESRTTPKADTEKAPVSKDSGGSAHKNGGKSESPRPSGPPTLCVGPPIRASLDGLSTVQIQLHTYELRTEEAPESLFLIRADQAEGSLA